MLKQKTHREIPDQPELDKLLFVIPLVLTLCGLLMIASITPDLAVSHRYHAFYYPIRQLIYIVLSCFLSIVVFKLIPLKFWFQINFVLFIGTLFLLILLFVPGIGVRVNGALRWLDLGFMRFQPSELLKLAMLTYLAGYLSKQTDWIKYNRLPLEPLVMFAIAACLLILEPDFTPIIILFVLVMSLLFIGGLAWRWLLAFLCLGLSSLLVLVYYAPYRLKRFATVIDPWSKQFDEGYQITQALLAIGRGGWFGKGIGKSVQKSFYLPEAHTDFLFAILVEELGVIVGLLMILCFMLLVARIMLVAIRAKQLSMMFTHYLVFGIAVLIGVQTVVNLGVNLGLLPTTGIPLPFLSYGGSHLLITAILVGICLRADYETKSVQSESV